MAVIDPKLALLDETDSGLNIDALRVVAGGVNALRAEDRAMIVITQYQAVAGLHRAQISSMFFMTDGIAQVRALKELCFRISKRLTVTDLAQSSEGRQHVTFSPQAETFTTCLVNQMHTEALTISRPLQELRTSSEKRAVLTSLGDETCAIAGISHLCIAEAFLITKTGRVEITPTVGPLSLDVPYRTMPTAK